MQHPTSLRLQHPYRFEVHFASIHVNTSKELTEYRSEIFNRNEISCRFEFISPLMWTYSSFNELEYVHMRDKMNSNRYEISFRLNISLQCSVNSLLVFMWIEAKSNSVHFPKIHRSILFLRRLWRQSVRKTSRQKYGLCMQNKCLYIISSFYKKTIDTAEDRTTEARHFKLMEIYTFF